MFIPYLLNLGETLIQLLIEVGANLDQSDFEGNTARSLAIAAGGKVLDYIEEGLQRLQQEASVSSKSSKGTNQKGFFDSKEASSRGTGPITLVHRSKPR